jgi:hypothetical protein
MARRVAAVLLALAAVAVAAGVLLTQGDDEVPTFTTVSNHGKPSKLELGRMTHMGGPGITGEAFLIAQREDRRFYRLPQVDGQPCFATARRIRGTWRLGSMTCQHRPQFLSRAFPLKDFSPIEMSLERPHPHYMWLAGIAADGVARVAVIDADNRVVPAADVVDNVYFTNELPEGDFFGLAALDGDGEIIWRSSPVG